MARRLVEAGVELISTTFDGPLARTRGQLE
jgi:hypothetical protein